MRTGPKCEKNGQNLTFKEATSDLEIEGQGHQTIVIVALSISTHIPNLKVLFFKLSCPKETLRRPRRRVAAA